MTPEPIRAFLTGQPTPREFRRISLTAQMRRTLTDLMQPTCLPQFTRAYREIKARELALSALSELQGDESVLRVARGKSARGPPRSRRSNYCARRSGCMKICAKSMTCGIWRRPWRPPLNDCCVLSNKQPA